MCDFIFVCCSWDFYYEFSMYYKLINNFFTFKLKKKSGQINILIIIIYFFFDLTERYFQYQRTDTNHSLSFQTRSETSDNVCLNLYTCQYSIFLANEMKLFRIFIELCITHFCSKITNECHIKVLIKATLNKMFNSLSKPDP